MLHNTDLPELRKAFGLTQTGLANLLGLHLRSYQDIENGRTELKRIHALAIERALMPLALTESQARALPAGLILDARSILRAMTDNNTTG